MAHTIATVFGFSFIFLATTLGASFVYAFRNGIPERANAIFFGFASGVMTAASIWSLLIPSVELSNAWGVFAFLPAVTGLLVGGVFMFVLDGWSVRYLHREATRTARLFLAVTLHNIPEGLAVGFAYGTGGGLSAFGLALGIGIQNIPEGAAVALPLVATGVKKRTAFFKGVLSGAFEPVFAVAGYFCARLLAMAQPWLLAFSAGTMLCVVAGDLLPEACVKETRAIGALGFLLGFAVMMSLDIALS